MRFQVETEASREVVFAEIADFANLENWDPLVRRSWLESGERLAEGAVYLLETRGGLKLRYRIVDLEQPRYVVYRGGTKRVGSTDTIEVEATDGGSLINVTSKLRFEGPMRLLSSLIGATVWLGARFLSLPALRRHFGSRS